MTAFDCPTRDLAYLKYGRLEQGFLRLRCEDDHHEGLVSFSCENVAFYPSCGARRMAEKCGFSH